MAIRPIILAGPGLPHRRFPTLNVSATGKPFVPVDLSGPLRQVRQAGGIEVTANLLLTVLAATSTVVMREPLYHSLPKQPAPFEYRVPNLLESTLRPAGAAPFSPQDFSRVAPAAPIPAWTPQNLLTSTLAPVAPGMPSQPLEQDTPRANQLTPADPQRNNVLLATPLVAAPFVPLDWPGLPRVQGPPAFAPPSPLLGVLTGQIPPFNQLAWFPLTPTQLQPQAAPSVNEVLLTTPAQIPFSQLNWPGLQPVLLPIDPAINVNTALFTTPQPQPFNQLNWPPLPSPLVPDPFLIPNTTIGQVPAAPPSTVFAVTPGKFPPWPWSWTHSPQKPDSQEFIRTLQRAMLREQQLRAEKEKLAREFKEKKLASSALPPVQQKSALQSREYAILRRKIRAAGEAHSQAVTQEIELRLRAVEHETAQQEAVAARRKRELLMVLLLA